jgi:NAD+ synthase (glutamine-hydrolysing)
MSPLRYLKVGGAALNQTPLDWPGNARRIGEAIAAARREGVHVLCLPELCISGYGCEDAFHGEDVARQALRSLKDLLPLTQGIAVAAGLPVIHGQNLFNCAAMMVDGRLAGFAAKRVLAGYGVYYEPRWFKAWPNGVQDTVEWEGHTVPIGDLRFDLGGVRVGFEICEDAWARSRLGQSGIADPADVLLNPSASHFAFDKYATLQGIVAEGSRVAHAAYVFANLLGNESGRLIFDGATLVACNGRLLAENPRFSYREMNLTAALVDLEALRLDRRRLTYPVDTQAVTPHAVQAPLAFAPVRDADIRAFRSTTESAMGVAIEPRAQAELGRDEEFARAVSLGLWDYLRKSRSRGFALSLSGGVDSSTCAVLAAIMVRRALGELGWAGFQKQLAHVPALPVPNGVGAEGSLGHVRALVRTLLLTVYQATANSSAETRTAASGLAEQVGSRHIELDVQALVEGYERLVEGALGRKLTWEQDDLARQNVQARVRSPGIWMLANTLGLLLLTTSNRSEVGVGYATMDGDTSGGLAPIAGANKTFLRHWLERIERGPVGGVGPITVLSAVNRQAPTAELRPLAAQQQDERDLMPYPVLDEIERAAIRDRLSPVEVWRQLLTSPGVGTGLSAQQAAAWVTRFFRLWSGSQWKRERLAPSFHLDDENLDPRTWCRFPILQGGYETELAALDAAVKQAGAQ